MRPEKGGKIHDAQRGSHGAGKIHRHALRAAEVRRQNPVEIRRIVKVGEIECRAVTGKPRCDAPCSAASCPRGTRHIGKRKGHGCRKQHQEEIVLLRRKPGVHIPDGRKITRRLEEREQNASRHGPVRAADLLRDLPADNADAQIRSRADNSLEAESEPDGRIPRASLRLAQIAQQEQRRQRRADFREKIREAADQRVEHRHHQKHRRHIPDHTVEAAHEQAAHLDQCQLEEIPDKQPGHRARSVMPHRADEEKSNKPRRHKLGQNAGDFAPEELRCLRTQCRLLAQRCLRTRCRLRAQCRFRAQCRLLARCRSCAAVCWKGCLFPRAHRARHHQIAGHKEEKLHRERSAGEDRVLISQQIPGVMQHNDERKQEAERVDPRVPVPRAAHWTPILPRISSQMRSLECPSSTLCFPARNASHFFTKAASSNERMFCSISSLFRATGNGVDSSLK